MACPHVAGVAAALWSYFPNCTSVQIRNVLNRSAKYMPEANPEEKCTPQYGHGLVQLSDAHDMITQGGCAAGGDNSIVTGGCDQLNNIDKTDSPTTSSSPSVPPPLLHLQLRLNLHRLVLHQVQVHLLIFQL